MMTLISVIGATGGQTLTVHVDIGPVTLTKDGWIALADLAAADSAPIGMQEIRT